MDRLKTNVLKFVDWVTLNRNLLFLAVCFMIHAVFAVVFYRLGIWLLALLNCFSCCFYIRYLLIARDTSEKSMVSTYFEIILFSVLSELALGPEFGFHLYIIGLAAAIFYLVPTYGNKRFTYEIFGIVTVFILEFVVKVFKLQFPNLRDPALPYDTAFYLVNLLITTTVVLSATFLYSKETDSVWDSLRYNMNHDALTGLYNRRFLERQIELIPDNKRRQYVIAMVDIDFFKKVNDTYGHEAGDAVLVKVAACLKETAQNENLAVRWGGEEFILYFPNTTPDKIFPLIESLRMRIENMVIETGGKLIHVTITSGIATGMADSNYEKVIGNADEKLYLGKQRGRNRVII